MNGLRKEDFIKARKDKMIECELCHNEICKYELDFRSCGGFRIWVNDKYSGETERTICFDCAKTISKAFIDN
jgi:hypothetical protein